MVRLSVNLNKIALLRNSRRTGVPSVLEFGRLALRAGAAGLTVHPRPDERHIRRSDVFELAELLRPHRPAIEYNIEGRPTDDFLTLVEQVKPEQVTLVPDAPGVLTSDAGWALDPPEVDWLRPVVAGLKATGARVCLFIDPDAEAALRAAGTGADGVEIYTGTYAAAFAAGSHRDELRACADAARQALSMGLVVNAGHDLNTRNLAPLVAAVPDLREVSIGHELTADALVMGFEGAIAAYRAVLAGRA
jgi:pyridoxine 5-phosphate synthase